MRKKILIFGTGDHSKVVLSEILKIKKFKVVGFIDEALPIKKTISKHKNFNIKVLGKIKDLKKIVDKNTYGVIGIGANYIREKIVKEVKQIVKNFKCDVQKPSGFWHSVDNMKDIQVANNKTSEKSKFFQIKKLIKTLHFRFPQSITLENIFATLDSIFATLDS